MNTTRIELCENTCWALVIATALLTATAIIGVSSHYYTQRMNAAFAAGYEEQTVQGTNQICWVKAK